MVLLDLSLGLLGDFPHLHLFLSTQANNLSDSLSRISVVLSAIFLQYSDDFGSREHKLDFLHEKHTNGMLIVLNIFDELDIQAYHCVQ